MVKKKVVRRYKKVTKQKSEGKNLLYGAVAIIVVAAAILTNVFAGKPSSGGGDGMAGCAGKTARPCFDKLAGGDVNLLGKNGANSFTACTSNAAPNKVGEFIHKTSICGQEKVTYCHDGKSNNFLRKFSGECITEPPPPPPPSPEPTPTTGTEPSPTSAPSAIRFRITSPNGGEQLPFGSQQVVRWEGGDTTNEWPIYLSIIDRNRNVAIREMVIATPNDGQENWIVDLPLGDYYAYYGQGCRGTTCLSAGEWDYSDAKFSVVAGSPVEKVTSSFSLNKSLVVLSPSGAEAWDAGSTQTIKWSGGETDWKIKIALIDNNASTTYTTLFTNLSNTGSASWTVPAYVPPGQYTMYAACTSCSAAPAGFTGGLYAYGFYPFTIR